MQWVYKSLIVVFVMLACCSCSNSSLRGSDTVSKIYSVATPLELQSNKLSGAAVQGLPLSVERHQEDSPCVALKLCNSKKLDQAASTAETMIDEDSSRDVVNSNSSSSNFTITEENGIIRVFQINVHPDLDLDLVQEPGESGYQSVNSIYSSELPNNAITTQLAEFKNVRFNQLSSPGSLHTINSIINDDSAKGGVLIQDFKFKKIEMIQSDSVGSVHSLNYVGKR